ncbi:AP-1 adaptor complex sigma subunit Aps1 [Mortierella alpina]|nr:AP-1 adaptor complex sigma subunit Aps1 [Mortierella alpina]
MPVSASSSTRQGLVGLFFYSRERAVTRQDIKRLRMAEHETKVHLRQDRTRASLVPVLILQMTGCKAMEQARSLIGIINFMLGPEPSINFVLLVSRQGKTRLAKWFTTMSPKEKTKIVKDVTQLVLSRRTKMCNFLEYKDTKVIYRRYASLFFITGIDPEDNELITLEIIHRYVEVLDRYFGNVCELDLIFNFQRAYFILDELLIAGEMQESSKKTVLRVITQQDAMEEEEAKEEKNK